MPVLKDSKGQAAEPGQTAEIGLSLDIRPALGDYALVAPVLPFFLVGVKADVGRPCDRDDVEMGAVGREIAVQIDSS